MSIDEQSRHQLYRRLEEILGPGPAATLMEHLPPVGWADVATKRDLDALEARLEGKLDRELGHVWHEFGRVHADIASWGRTIVLANIAMVIAAVGLAFGAARL
jgi:hypothetical protein